MSRDREIAEAISEGINCTHAIVAALRAGASSPADPGWPGTLQALGRALDGVRANEVMSSMVVGEDDCARVRTLNALCADWVNSGRPPAELLSVAEEVLHFLGMRG